MTEVEWLACDDPERMFDFLCGPPNTPRRPFCLTPAADRKLRLAGCACARRLWHLLPDDRSRTAIEVGERFADGRATAAEFAAAWRTTNRAIDDAAHSARDAGAQAVWKAVVAACHSLSPQGWEAADWAAFYARWAVRLAASDAAEGWEAQHQCRLLRCVIGNPFRPPAPPHPAWRARHDYTAPRLARALYEERRFDDLPVLADALEDAGCADPDWLGHLREPGPHARGCWPVDLLLGKG
jgi:hypothetical protein